MYHTKENGRIQTLPYDKFRRLGPKALTEEELLAIILRTGVKGMDALSLACLVMEQLGTDKGLLGLFHATTDDLMKIRGIGEVKAIQLKAIAELSLRISQARVKKDICLRSPADVASAYMERMRHLEREQCVVVFLDTSDCRIADEVISQGDLTSTLISAREIFRRALLLNASSIIVLHNHPSGNPTPSNSDIKVTERLREASGFMEIPILDHVIIGDQVYYSLKERGEL
ncbi:MAG: DNA repair protein RadC [Lachnospiraceae bacterium]|nr:DNA repair protein RadC [Lachnospiraceae bacterium]